jgi:uncharacterized membrane protein YidH (DUF202 family)
MRAICGAIISAGALIGLGLTALAYGIRYQGWHEIDSNTGHMFGATSMMIALVILIVGVFVGLGIAFLGLMFHHYQRYHEHMRNFPTTTNTNVTRTPV